MTDEEKRILTEMYDTKLKFYYRMCNQKMDSPLMKEVFIELNTMAKIFTKLGISLDEI